MKIINRFSTEVLVKKSRNQQRHFVTVGNRVVYFTVMTALFCGIKEGSFIQFMNEGNDWQFYVNDDTDGFVPIRVDSVKNEKHSYRICNDGLVNMILSSTGFKKKKRFSVKKTELFQDRSPIFQLSLEDVPTINN